MINSFRHKGLRKFFSAGSGAGIQPKHAQRLRLILSQLDSATVVEDMGFPGAELHPLKGDRKGFWAVKVSGNWRITFKFEAGDALEVDYEDYH